MYVIAILCINALKWVHSFRGLYFLWILNQIKPILTDIHVDNVCPMNDRSHRPDNDFYNKLTGTNIMNTPLMQLH